MDPALTDIRWNQIFRNHLLVESIRQREPGLLGCEIVVHHPYDSRCVATVAAYRILLSEPDDTFSSFTLADIITAWRPLVASTKHRQWLVDFDDRYMKLELSQS